MKNQDYFIFLRKQPPRKSYSAICDSYSSMSCISIPIILSSYPEYHIQKHSLGGVLQKRCPSKFRKIHRNHMCQSFFFTKVAVLSKKEALAQVFSCEFCEISRNTVLTEHLRWMLLQMLLYMDVILISSWRSLAVTAIFKKIPVRDNSKMTSSQKCRTPSP